MRVLYVDDDPGLLESGQLFLEETCLFQVETALSAAEALSLLASKTYDAIVSDYRMPGMDGVAFLQHLRGSGDATPFIVFTVCEREEVVVEAFNSGADAYLLKEGDPNVLFAALANRIRLAVERKEARDALARSNERLEVRTRTLSIINEIITTTSRAESLGDLVREALDRTIDLLDFDAGGVYLVDPDAGTATVVHSRNLQPEFLAEIRTIVLTEPPYDTIFVRNEPIITEHYERINPEQSRTYGILSLASVPLVGRGRVNGAVNVISTRRQAISALEAETLVSIGLELGGAIERMGAEEEVKRAAENFETLFNSIDEMVFVLDLQGRILKVNDTVLKRLRYGPDEVIGRDVLDLHVPDRREEASRIVQGMIAGTIDTCLVPLLSKDGTLFEVETRITRGVWNGIDVLIGVTRDVTERKRVERALEEKTRELDQYFSTSLDLFCIADTDGYFRRLNPQWEQTLGYTIADLEGRRFLDFVHPDDLPNTLAAIADLDSKRSVLDFTNRYRHRDGSYRWIEWRSFPSPDSSLIFAAARDITARKQAEGELRASKDQFRLLLDSTAEAIYGLDMNGDCTFCNPACLRLLGYSRPEELIGRNMHWLIHHSHADGTPFPVETCRIFQAFQRGEGTHVDDEVLWRADGTSFPAEYWSYPQYRDGAIVGAVVTFVDISERTQAAAAQREYERLLHLLLDLSTRFINVEGGALGQEIDACLARIGAFAAVDRGYIVLLSPDGTRATELFEWCADGIPSRREEFLTSPMDQFIWAVPRLRRSEVVHIPDIDDLPPEALFERRVLRGLQVRSTILVPLAVGGTWMGVLGFESMRRHRAWPDQVIALFEVTARMIANAVSREVSAAALADREEQLELVIEGSGAGLWDWRVRTGETFINDRWAEIAGYTLAELGPTSTDHWSALCHPDDLARSQALVERHFRGESPDYECEVRMRHRDGSWVWVLDRGKVVERDDEGRPVRMTGTHLDITPRKKAEAELARQTALLASLLDSIPDIVFFKDTDGRYLGCNPPFAAFVGRSRDEIVGRTDHDLFPAPAADSFRDHDRAMLAGQVPEHNEEWVDFPDGHRELLDTLKAPLRALDGAVVGLVGISRDITERKRNEQAIWEANRKLNMLNSITRHDVLNQITVLRLVLDILGESVEDPEILDFAGKAKDAVDRITRQIEFTREYQDIGVQAPRWQSVPALIAEAQDLLTSCPFEVRCETGPLECFADPLLNKVFYNLLENSVRHGERVGLARFSTRETDDGLVLVYEDDGVGVDPASKKHLFQQGFGKHTGFGLYLMREILAITGITIVETGEYGRGARFEIAVAKGNYRFGGDPEPEHPSAQTRPTADPVR
jgi:PAS domain S-box-containing protein